MVNASRVRTTRDGLEAAGAGYDRRSLYNGFGDTMAKAVEFVAAPCLLAWLGHVVDGRAGTGPLFTVGLAGFGLVGVFVRFWFAYVEAMKAEEARGPWSSR